MPYAVSVTSLMPPGEHKIIASVEYPAGHPLPQKTYTVRINNPYYGKNYSDPDVEALKKENPGCSVAVLQQDRAVSEWKIGAYSGCQDTQLHAPNAVADRSMGQVNFGQSSKLEAGFYGMEHRTLIRCELGGIPPAAKVVKAVLMLHLQKGSAAGLDAHRMLKSWTEGQGSGSLYKSEGEELGLGGNARAGEPNWSNRGHPATAWGAPGGKEGEDFEAAAITGTCPDAKNGPGKSEELVWVRWDLTEFVRQWFAKPEENRGVMITGSPKNPLSTFRSSQYADPLFRPKLLIVYHP